MANEYFEQVKLLLEVLPATLKEDCFALKGGTAINMFFLDMPRYSVDIDLCYTPIENRADSLKNIETALLRIEKRIQIQKPGVKLQTHRQQDGTLSKLFLRTNRIQIKIEANLLVRGTVFPCEEHDLSKSAQLKFNQFTTARTVSVPDVWGGKICAALDRQHPRDLFDIINLFNTIGINDRVRKSFIVYLLSSNRPFNEILNPTLIDFKKTFEEHFDGMTTASVSYADLIATRTELIKRILSTLTLDERNFIVSFNNGQPQWPLLGLNNVENLPAVRWRLENIMRFENKNHKQQLNQLKNSLKL